MKKRKQYIIDRKYQLRTTFQIIGIVTVVTAFILGSITASVVYNNARLNDNNAKIENIYMIENSIFTMLSSVYTTADPALKKATQESSNKHDQNMATLEKMIAYNNTIITYNKFLLLAILIVVVFECIFLYIMLIRQTHRVSGPIYVISSFMRDIIEGREPVLRPLRNKDELKDFYELFKDMVAAIKKREIQ
jgi:hypothetical protein